MYGSKAEGDLVLIQTLFALLWKLFLWIICLEVRTIDHFTVVDLVPWPTSECEAEVDLVLIQTFFDLLWKLSLKNTS